MLVKMQMINNDNEDIEKLYVYSTSLIDVFLNVNWQIVFFIFDLCSIDDAIIITRKDSEISKEGSNL